MIVVAVMVCAFAVGMAGLLNYFKYRSTVHRIVTDYNGAIQVTSAVGSGTTMRVRLPGQHTVAEGNVPRPVPMRSAIA